MNYLIHMSNTYSIDGAIKYNNNYYLVKLKWITIPSAHMEVASLYVKVESKIGVSRLFVSMNDYSKEIIKAQPKRNKIIT